MKKEYGKLVNEILRRAPKTVLWNGHKVNNPDPDKLIELGYLPVRYTEAPADEHPGQHYEPDWVQTEKEILQTWHLVEDIVYPEPEPTMQDLVEAVERGLDS